MTLARTLGLQLTMAGLAAYESAARSVKMSNAGIADSMGAAAQATTQMEERTRGLLGTLEAASPGLAVLGGTLSALGGGALALGKKFAMTAARSDELRIVMEVVGQNANISKERLHELEMELRNVGMTVDASRTMLTQFMQSELDVAQATDIATAAQNMAVVAGLDSSLSAQRLTAALVGLNPMLLWQFGIITSGEKMYGKYAKSVGKTAEQLTVTEKRQAMLNTIMESASKYAGVYAEAMKNPAKMMRSLSRYAHTATLAIGEHLFPAFRAIVFATKDVLKFIIALPPVVHKLIASVIAATAAIGLLTGALALKLALLPKIASQLALVKVALSAVVKTVLPLSIPLAALGATIGLVALAIKRDWGGLGTAIEQVMTSIKEAMAPVIEIWQNWGQQISAQVQEVVSLVVGRLQPIFEQLAAGIGSTLGRATSYISKFGEHFNYVFRAVSLILDSFKELLSGNAEEAGRLFARAWQTALASVIVLFKGMVQRVVGWGRNLMASYAGGIIEGIKTYLASALQSVASFISGMMKAKSPPQFLPDLGKWGTEAMNVYLAGFSSADFNMLKDLAERFRGPLELMVLGGEIEVGKFAETFVELREALASVISIGTPDWTNWDVFEESLENISSSLGEVGQGLVDVIRLQVRYQEEAEGLARIQERFEELDDALRPFSEAIERAEAAEVLGLEELRQKLEAGEITEEQYEAGASALHKQVEEARRQQRIQHAMQVEERIALRNAQRQAQDRMDELKEEMAIAEAKLDLHYQTKQVMEQQKDIMAKLADAVAKLSIEDLGESMEEVAEATEAVAQALGEAEDLQVEVELDLGETMPEVESLRDALGGLFQDMLDKAMAIPWVKKVLTGLGKTFDLLGKAAKSIGQIISQTWGGIQRLAKRIWPDIERVLLAWSEVVTNVIGDFVGRVMPSLVGIFAAVLRWLEFNWPRVEIIVRTVIEGVTGALAYLAETIGPLVTDAFAAISIWLEEHWPKIAATIIKVMHIALSAIEDLLAALQSWWAEHGEQVKAGFESFITWLRDNVPATLSKVASFWEDVLAPALKKVWAFIQGSVIPIFQALVSIYIAAMIKNVKDLASFWSETLWPALQKVWAFIQENIIPIFQSLVEIYIAAMMRNISDLADFWSEVLWPALKKVWAFIQENVMPIFQDLVEIYISAMKKNVTDLASLWSDTLYPALDKVRKVIEEDVVPWLKEGARVVEEVLGKAINWFMEEILNPFLSGLEELSRWASLALDVLNKLANVIRGMPDAPVDLVSHSMAPWAQGLADIAEQAHRLAGVELPRLASEIRVVMPAMPAAAGGGGGGQVDRSVHIEVNAAYANQQSEAEIYYDVVAALAAASL